MCGAIFHVRMVVKVEVEGGYSLESTDVHVEPGFLHSFKDFYFPWVVVGAEE